MPAKRQDVGRAQTGLLPALCTKASMLVAFWPAAGCTLADAPGVTNRVEAARANATMNGIRKAANGARALGCSRAETLRARKRQS
ncbi:MAG: hypothetical protein V1874_06510 [Spirochaetota bacterium]